MKERPILFSAPMVRAILDGSKTQTRRVAKEFSGRGELDAILKRFPNQNGCPYGKPGDRLWVRETFGEFIDYDTIDGRTVELGRDWVYRADEGARVSTKWTPSIHMPRAASRILLEIVSVRVERLQDIGEDDARAEGAWPNEHIVKEVADYFKRDILSVHPSLAFRMLWERINGAGCWDANPWVWVVEFKRVTP